MTRPVRGACADDGTCRDACPGVDGPTRKGHPCHRVVGALPPLPYYGTTWPRHVIDYHMAEVKRLRDIAAEPPLFEL